MLHTRWPFFSLGYQRQVSYIRIDDTADSLNFIFSSKHEYPIVRQKKQTNDTPATKGHLIEELQILK